MQLIQSRHNKIIKEILSLKSKKYRRMKQCYIVEGFRFVREALMSGTEVRHICFSTGFFEKTGRELEPLMNSQIRCFEVPEGLFRQLAETDSPQGVLAVVHITVKPLSYLYRKGFRGLILDCVQDPGNAGTVIRSAHALGFDAVVATKSSVDIFSGKVLRATMGSLFYIPVIDCMEEEEILSFCRKHDVKVIISRPENAKACHETDLSGGFFLVVGNEGKGVSGTMESKVSEYCFIPMPGGAESFNAAVAASILMYESNRQRINVTGG